MQAGRTPLLLVTGIASLFLLLSTCVRADSLKQIYSPAKSLLQNRFPVTEAMTLAMSGLRLSPDKASLLERKLAANPNDLTTLTRLLGYYSERRFQDATAREAYERLVVLLIRIHPDAAISGTPFAELFPEMDDTAYSEARQLWMQQIDKHPKDTLILGNAANFLLIPDSQTAERLLKKAQALEPENPEWSMRLGQLYSLSSDRRSGAEYKRAAQQALEQYERAYPDVKDPEHHYILLEAMAKVAVDAGALDKARTYANQLLKETKSYRALHLDGDAIHHGNIVLGRVALREGNIEKAKSYLLAAGKTSGSAPLDSFGPNMLLAKELLEKGQRQVVLEYFQECAKFWHRSELEAWARDVKQGLMPDFGANLVY